MMHSRNCPNILNRVCMTLRGKQFKTSLFCKFSYWIISYMTFLLSSVFIPQTETASWNNTSKTYLHSNTFLGNYKKSSIVMTPRYRNWNYSYITCQVVHIQTGTQLWAELNSATPTWAITDTNPPIPITKQNMLSHNTYFAGFLEPRVQ